MFYVEFLLKYFTEVSKERDCYIILYYIIKKIISLFHANLLLFYYVYAIFQYKISIRINLNKKIKFKCDMV